MLAALRFAQGPRMKVLGYGDRALLVELGDTATVVAWTDAVTAAGIPGVGDLVPAAETLLVVAAEGADVDAVRHRLEGLEVDDSGEAGETSGESLEIPVT
jgi:allophanate hydrolase subunit 1